MAEINVNLQTNADLFRNALPEQIAQALEAIGMTAERHAKEIITELEAVDTGRLRNSISHARDDNAAYIGTNVEYAAYVELGTGIYAEEGGRKTPWSYKDENGEWHRTSGMKPRPYLRPAALNYVDEYKEIVKTALQG